ncbi:MAG: hypothetical protein AABX94_02445 [Nanoarchaeota archaeon]|mgnify:FL=1
MSLFNALIEGYFLDHPNDSRLKLANLDISQNVSLLSDGVCAYRLIGVTPDFKTINEVSSSFGNEVSPFDIPELRNIEGVVLPYRGSGLSEFIEIPRSVLLRDGILFISMLEKDYLSFLKSDVLEKARHIFSDSGFDRLYERIVFKR